ncbi:MULTISPECIES: RHS repeat domain-containing protein [unclassified Corallococcus]|uniref:RHS repeat domain-containing protein n=1 Tax=unclassified Corallococcus TaxID=2685029 RepID=UPI001A8E602B|nr:MULTISPECIES: RHS repeat-associated core domain-containing protein [unclassified Corallococcus]MBN9685005.1 RHS repeat-associated core domain-containing protein [Corallococcus sp. NCSPR001]WAS83535.1 hypothetical protein O0N60_29995 [Corallococcus sp. NCRR]
MAQAATIQGGDASNANNFRDPLSSDVNPRTGRLRISVAAPRLPGLGGLDVDLGIDYTQSDQAPPRTVLGLPAMWQFRLSYIVGGRIVINGSQSHALDQRWPCGMKYHVLQDMSLETLNKMPALPFEEAKDQRSLNILSFLDGRKQYFDLHGRLIASADPHGNHILYFYEEPADRSVFFTRLTRIVDTYGQTVSFEYPANGIQITLPPGDGSAQRILYEFDSPTALKAYHDPAGRKTLFTHGGGQLNRRLLTRIQSPNQFETLFTYKTLDVRKEGKASRLDVIHQVIRKAQGIERTTEYNLDPNKDHRNYTGNPTYELSSKDTLMESTDHRYRYVTTVDDGATLTRRTYNRLHLELKTEVYSKSDPGDLITTTLFTYPGQGADVSFPAHNALPKSYERPAQVEVRTYDAGPGGDTKPYRARKTVNAYNDAGQPTATEVSTAAAGGAFQTKRKEVLQYDPRFGLLLLHDVHDYQATGLISAQPVITRVVQTLSSDGSQVVSTQTGFVTDGAFSASRTTRYEYDAAGRVTLQTDTGASGTESSALQTAYTHAPGKHRLTVQQTDAVGDVRSQEYDTATGLLSSETNARGTTTYGYDTLGRKSSTVDPLGVTTTWTYDDATRSTTVVNANGYSATLRDNGFGELLLHTDNAGPQGAARVHNSRTYDALGRLIQETGILGEGSKLTYAYDTRGRLSQLTDSEGNVSTYAYDELQGSQTEFFNGIKLRTQWFDDEQRILQEESFQATPGTSRATLTGHDGNGNVVLQKTGTRAGTAAIAWNSTQRITRDILGNEVRTETTGSDGTTVIHLEDRDLHGQVLRTTRTLQRAGQASAASVQGETCRYDAAGHLLQASNPLGQNETLTYEHGAVKTRQDLAGTLFTRTYDAVGQLTEERFTEGNVIHRFVRAHDNTTRRLTSVEHLAGNQSHGRIEYTYSPEGLLTSTRSLPEDKTLQWEYSATTNQLRCFTDAAGVATRFTYTRGGQVETVSSGSDASAKTLTVGYYSKADSAAHSGKVQSLTFSGGLAIRYQYDGAGRVATVQARAGTQDVLTVAYSYDEATGFITRKVFSSARSPQDVSLNHQVSYQYDGLGQLLHEEVQDPKGVLLTRRTYGYDAAGNVTRQTLTRAGLPDETTGFTYDADNKLLTLQLEGGSPRSLAYDLLGNLTDDGAGRTFQYNALGQLTGFKSKTLNYTYTYHPDGLRKSKCQASQTPVRFYYDGRPSARLVNEIQDATSVSHVQAGDLRFARQVPGQDTQEFLHDQSHVVAALTGQALSGVRYGAYGEQEPVASGPRTFQLQDNPFGYKGEYQDVESGLVYLRARYYDPQLMRFISRDSAPLLNRYQYALGNPVMLTDPSGNLAWWEWLTLGAALVASVVVTIATAGAGSALLAGALASTSTLVSLSAEVGIAVAAGVAGALVGKGVEAFGYSAREGRWGLDRYFDKELGIEVGLAAISGGIGAKASFVGNKVVAKVVGTTGRKAVAAQALVGFAVGSVEALVAEPLLQQFTKGKVDWDERIFGALVGGGFAGAGSTYLGERARHRYLQRTRTTPVVAFNPGTTAGPAISLGSAGGAGDFAAIRSAYRQLDAAGPIRAPKPPAAPAQFLLPGFLP